MWYPSINRSLCTENHEIQQFSVLSSHVYFSLSKILICFFLFRQASPCQKNKRLQLISITFNASITLITFFLLERRERFCSPQTGMFPRLPAHYSFLYDAPLFNCSWTMTDLLRDAFSVQAYSFFALKLERTTATWDPHLPETWFTLKFNLKGC